MGKTTLSFYGGVGHIGGNTILLESNGTRVLFDFGLDLGKQNKYFSQFLRPRKAHALYDFQEFGLLPELKGIYRKDYLRHLGEEPKEEPSIDAVFLTHGHIDHVGNVHFLRNDIPIYCSKKTKEIMETRQETMSMSFNEYVTFKESFCLRKRSRKDGLTRATSRYASDMVEEERDIRKAESEKEVNIGGIRVTPYTVDHSLPGAQGFLIETEGKRLVYTGDFRLKGYHKEEAEDFIKAAEDFEPDVLITEGTNIKEVTGPSELDVRRSLIGDIQATKDLSIINFPSFDLDRMQSVYKAARASGRKLVIRLKQAYLIQQLENSGLLEFPELSLSNDNILVYKPKKGWGSSYHRLKHPELGWRRLEEMPLSEENREWLIKRDYYSWEKEFVDRDCCIGADEIKRNQGRYVFYCNYYQLKDLIDVKPQDKSRFIWSKTEPFCPDMEVNFERVKNWLSRFQLESNVPRGSAKEVKEEIHASGHVYRGELMDVIDRVDPETVFPIHTEHPEVFKKYLGGKVKLPTIGKKYLL